MTKLAIVILNWNGRQFLEKFLQSVVNHCPDYGQVVIADNGSEDGSVEFVERHFPDVKLLLLGENFGYTGGYNRALSSIDAEYCILLNSDIEVTKGWIEPVVDLMDSDHQIAACQPKILSYDHKDQFEYAGAAGGFIDFLGYPFCRGRIFDNLEMDQGQYDQTREIFWATGACMFVRRADFLQAGSLDDDFFAHMEEIDLCWRMKRLGKKIFFCHESQIFHVGGGTLPRNNPRKTYLNFRNNLMMLSKNLPSRRFYPVLLFRIILDQIAAFKFLISGQPADWIAVQRAIISALLLLKTKRKEGKKIPFTQINEVYRGSIIWEHFILGRKMFSDLPERLLLKQ